MIFFVFITQWWVWLEHEYHRNDENIGEEQLVWQVGGNLIDFILFIFSFFYHYLNVQIAFIILYVMTYATATMRCYR